ncbi:MAG: Fur family transcriptional regulator [Marinifilaceae bacterium]
MVDVNSVERFLQNNDIRPSAPRVKIMEYLLVHRNHPTVDQIYSDLKDELTSLSKTTVYNTLKLFVERGITLLINIEDNETRYDADTSVHGHFKCRSCGGVFDLSIRSDMFQLSGIENFEVEEYHLYLKGICRVCKERVCS